MCLILTWFFDDFRYRTVQCNFITLLMLFCGHSFSSRSCMLCVCGNKLLPSHLFLTRLWPSPCCSHEQKDPWWQDQSPGPMAMAVLSAERAKWTHMWLCFNCKEMGLNSGTLL